MRPKGILLVVALAVALIVAMLVTLYGVRSGKIKTRHGAYGVLRPISRSPGADAPGIKRFLRRYSSSVS
ncbi:MAG: hypothetical protein C0608_01265 [Deltaproteobacteria bacterium]|nr:MAG: hypothetical protein C0608_01265 [Deltaproteobacteria bacterium]